MKGSEKDIIGSRSSGRKKRERDRQTDRQRGGVVEDKIRKNLYRENE